MIDPEDLAASKKRRDAQMPGHRRQKVLNARQVPERQVQTEARPPVPVRARIVWEVDGVEIMDVRANGWVNRRGLERVVLLELRDVRCGWVWVSADDVQRRTDGNRHT